MNPEVPAIVAAEVDFARVFPLRLTTNFGLLFELFPFEQQGALLSPCCRAPLFSPEGFNSRTSLCRGCLKSNLTPARLVADFKVPPLAIEAISAVTELYLSPLESVLVAQNIFELLLETKEVPLPTNGYVSRLRYRRALRLLALRPLL